MMDSASEKSSINQSIIYCMVSIHNSAIFKFSLQFLIFVSSPFSVTPDIGTLAMKESMQVTIEFKPLGAGDHKGEMCLTYDTG